VQHSLARLRPYRCGNKFLLVRAVKKPLATPLYRLFLGVSGGGALTIMAPSAGYLALTTKSYGDAKASPELVRGYPMYFYRAEGYGCIPLLLFLSHYLRFLDIHPPDDMCITSYCDNSSLLNHEEEFYTRDIDSSSLLPSSITIMTPRTNFPLYLASLHVRATITTKCRATDAIMDPCPAAKSTEFYS
jgi:hypothetical protein